MILHIQYYISNIKKNADVAVSCISYSQELFLWNETITFILCQPNKTIYITLYIEKYRISSKTTV